MRLPKSAILAAAIASSVITTVNGAPADDMASLRESCEGAASVLNASLNNTMAMDTAGLIQNITWQVGASKANLGNLTYSIQTTSTTASAQTQPSNATSTLDSMYFDYADAIGTLAEAALRRGRTFHQEANQPVYNAVQGLATGVQAYGLVLRNANLISQGAAIRTFTAGSALVVAQSAWADNANMPLLLRRGRVG